MNKEIMLNNIKSENEFESSFSKFIFNKNQIENDKWENEPNPESIQNEIFHNSANIIEEYIIPLPSISPIISSKKAPKLTYLSHFGKIEKHPTDIGNHSIGLQAAPLVTEVPVFPNPAVVFPVPEITQLPPLPEINPVVPKPEVIPAPVVEIAKPVTKQHYKKPKDYSGELLAEDKFADDPNRFTLEQARKARLLARIVGGKEPDLVKIINKHGLLFNDILAAQTIGKIFEQRMQAKFKDVVNAPNWEDLKARMEFLLMRFMIQHFEGQPMNIGQLNEQTLTNLTVTATDQSMLAYKETMESHLPWYDKLFAELDAMRENGRNPLEVYLGRDGIYAYVGRRALDVSQRRKMGWQKRREAKLQGKLPGLNVKYLVYPRLFRDTLSSDLKSGYLEDSGVTKESDPVFYDTGFVGTIPDQILRLLGYLGDEVDSRMKLLSASKESRRVKGISEQERNAIVNKIEYSAKAEEVAVGLFRDPKTGRIRPVAQPTSPQEQLMYEMMKLAIAEYYYSQGEK